jgi:sec-independent protein translocase protein TatA
MFNLPGGWEIILIVVIVAILLGGSKAINSMKEAARGAYKFKREIDDIKDDITSSPRDQK